MFMLYAIPIGIVVGMLLGGRIERLGALSFRWVPLALAGLAVQIALFSTPLTESIGRLGPPLYVASTAAVVAVVLRNRAIPGMTIVALGAGANLVAIVANGGYMPTSPDALAALGRAAETGYSNSAMVAEPALAALTDVLAMPGWVPFANVFSVGDVLIGLGVAGTIAIAMRGPGSTPVHAGDPVQGGDPKPGGAPVPAGNSPEQRLGSGTYGPYRG